MTPIEKLKALEADATPAPWFHELYGDGAFRVGSHRWENPIVASRNETATPEASHADAALISAVRTLAPELIALWGAASRYAKTDETKDARAFLAAIDDLNAKAAEILP